MTFEQYWMIFIGAVITVLVNTISNYLKDMRKKAEEEQRIKDDTLKLLVESTKELKEWRESEDNRMQKVMAMLDEHTKQLSLFTECCKAILRDRILQSCRVFIQRGKITMVARANIKEMYKWYKAAGGNGYCEELYNEAMKLEVDDTPTVPYINSLHSEMEAVKEASHV